jgi:hypothetical protein
LETCCTIVLLSDNNHDLVRHFLRCFFACPPKVETEVHVADLGRGGDAQDQFGDYLDRIRLTTDLRDASPSQALDSLAAQSSSEYVLFLPVPVSPAAGWVDALIAAAERSVQVGAIGSKVLLPTGSVHHAGVVICQDRYPRHLYRGFPADHAAVNRSRAFQVVRLDGALVRRSAFERVGGLNAEFDAFVDVDFCLRLGMAGFDVRYAHESVLHLLSSNVGSLGATAPGHQLYISRWGKTVRPDEFDYYFDDGLLAMNHRQAYPVEWSISPMIATIDDVDRRDSALSLLHTRADLTDRLMQQLLDLSERLPTESGSVVPERTCQDGQTEEWTRGGRRRRPSAT